jgi:hypothetical protein
MPTHFAPQDVLPLPISVQQAAESHRLGTFSKAYQATLVRSIAIISIFLLSAVGFSAAAIFGHDLKVGTIVLSLLLALLFVVGSLLIFRAIEATQRQIYLFQHGLVIERRNQIEVLAWRDIQVCQSITRRSSNGIYVGTTYIYKLRRADGYHIELGTFLVKNVAELGQAITKGVTQEQVPSAFAAIRAGQTLVFDPFRINQHGIGFKQELLPWTHVEAIVVSRGSVTIKKMGTRAGSWLALVSKTPNVMVFLVIAEEMRQQAGRESQ